MGPEKVGKAAHPFKYQRAFFQELVEGKDHYLKFYSVCCFSFSVLHLKDFVKRKWELRVFKLLPVLTMTFSNTLSSILSSSLMKSTFLFSLQSFYFPACPKLIGEKKKKEEMKIVLLDTATTFTFFPFFFSSQS